MKQGFELALAGLMALTALALGGWVGMAEFRSAPRVQGPALSRLADIDLDRQGVGFSPMRQRALLMDCEYGLRAENSLEARFVGAETMASIPALCTRIALTVAQRNSGNALAWTVAAAGMLAQEGPAEANLYLANSYNAAPRETWLARLRVGVVGGHEARIDGAAKAGYLADLAALAGDQADMWALAQRFVTDPAFRPYMTEALASLPEATQKTFLDGLSGLMTRGGM
ncbi:hypothetical protein [Devosia sp.]|uniref:hypothetical protein n=1 Tax=Devosia sp. TaxID=1871048 RepID=UPI002B0031B7|nr:hypothetical protein [Devosia sp.]